jgi:hypothetical protein
MNYSKKAQGSIEYLLIIGAAILVVAVVIVAISGVLFNSTAENDSQETYTNGLMDMRYEHIGFPISVSSGQHDSFVLALQPKNTSLPEIFSTAPIGTKVKLNQNQTYYYKLQENDWNNGGNEAKLNQGDIVYISLPLDSTKTLSLNLKGDYVKLTPRKINLSCPPEGGNLNLILPFQPKQTDPKIVFENFITDNSVNRVESYLTVYDLDDCYLRYTYPEGCYGELSVDCNQITNSTECSYNNYPACQWNFETTTCYQFNGCTTLMDWSATKEKCLSFGCQYGSHLVNSSSCENIQLSEGTIIEMQCIEGQEFSTVFEENTSSAQKTEFLTIDESGGIITIARLKNYSCYTTQKLFDKIREQIPNPVLSPFSIYVECSLNEESSNIFAYNLRTRLGTTRYAKLNEFAEIYRETSCLISAYGLNLGTINLTC